MNILLSEIVQKLKNSKKVEGVFVTGSTARGLLPSSDIDLIVILNKNEVGVKSIYTLIEKRFSDIFFFDSAFVEKISKSKEVDGNSTEGMFLRWLGDGEIVYDPKSTLLLLKRKVGKKRFTFSVSDFEKYDAWVRVNYNYLANLRYYRSRDVLYRKALAIRLMYSVVELITSYFAFRGVVWRGEKAAVSFWESNDKGYYSLFRKFADGRTLDERMKQYRAMFKKTLYGKYRKWRNDFVVAVPQARNMDTVKMTKFWEEISH